MEVIFKAKDGAIFYSAEECVKYESTLVNEEKDWEAWGWDGKPTKSTANAIVVNLPTDEAAAQFLEEADLNNDSSIVGISKNSRGWYYYDYCADEYFRINEEIIDIFISISAS